MHGLGRSPKAGDPAHELFSKKCIYPIDINGGVDYIECTLREKGDLRWNKSH